MTYAMEEKMIRRFSPAVNPALCKECGYCREVCPQGVFESSDRLNAGGYRYMTARFADKCTGCYKCLMICPDFAVTVEPLTEK